MVVQKDTRTSKQWKWCTPLIMDASTVDRFAAGLSIYIVHRPAMVQEDDKRYRLQTSWSRIILDIAQSSQVRNKRRAGRTTVGGGVQVMSMAAFQRARPPNVPNSTFPDLSPYSQAPNLTRRHAVPCRPRSVRQPPNQAGSSARTSGLEPSYSTGRSITSSVR